MKNWKFCPKCGSKKITESGERSIKCEACGHESYDNTAAAVAAVITDGDGKLLVTKRKYEPAQGTLDLPGGFVEFDETGEEALKREVHEELGIELTDIKYYCSMPNVYRWGEDEVHTLDMFFSAKMQNESQIKPMDDVCEAIWIEKEELKEEDFGLKSIRKTISMITGKNNL